MHLTVCFYRVTYAFCQGTLLETGTISNIQVIATGLSEKIKKNKRFLNERKVSQKCQRKVSGAKVSQWEKNVFLT